MYTDTQDKRFPVVAQRGTAAAGTGRMEALARLPIFLALAGKRAVVFGGSAAAAWKAELLSAAGARVEVYAAEISDELRAVAADPPRGSIIVHARGWTANDLAGAVVAVGAFEQEADAAAFSQAARNSGIPVNVIDKPALCDFAFGAIVNRSPLVIGISTDGAAPVFAQAIRAKLETLLPRGFSLWAAAAQSWRSALAGLRLTAAARRKFWRLFAAHAIVNADAEPDQADFDRLMSKVQEQGSAVEKGSLTYVSAGPGEADLLTLRAVRALQSADVIVFDETVSRAVLDFARREARKLLIRETDGEGAVEALIAGLVRRGKHVVRLRNEAASSARNLESRDQTSINADGARASSAGRNGAAA